MSKSPQAATTNRVGCRLPVWWPVPVPGRKAAGADVGGREPPKRSIAVLTSYEVRARFEPAFLSPAGAVGIRSLPSGPAAFVLSTFTMSAPLAAYWWSAGGRHSPTTPFFSRKQPYGRRSLVCTTAKAVRAAS
eukprot:1520815-Prymnesium_polylepis.2